MRRFSSVELALLIIPALVIPLALTGRRAAIQVTPNPRQTPTPTPIPNCYSNFYSTAESILPSLDGKTIHTGNQNSELKFHTWDARSGKLIRRFGDFRMGNAGGILSPDGTALGFGHGGWKGDRVVLFNTATGKEFLQLQIPKAVGYGFALNNDFVALPTNDEIRLFSAANGRFIKNLRHKSQNFFPTQPSFSRDGKKLLWIGYTNHSEESYANGEASDEIVWFNVETGRKIKSIEVPKTIISGARFSGDARVILAYGTYLFWTKSGGGKKAIADVACFFAFSSRTGKKLYSWRLFTPSYDVAVSPDGKWFTYRHMSSPGKPNSERLAIHEVQTGKEVHHIPTGFFASPGAWSPDSKTLYIEDGLVKRLQLQIDGSWNERTSN